MNNPCKRVLCGLLLSMLVVAVFTSGKQDGVLAQEAVTEPATPTPDVAATATLLAVSDKAPEISAESTADEVTAALDTLTMTPVASLTENSATALLTFAGTPIALPALTINPLPVVVIGGGISGAAYCATDDDSRGGVVLILYDDFGTRALAATFEDGSFRLAGILPGAYMLRAVRNGYLSVSVPIEIYPGVTRELPSLILLAGDLNGDDAIDDADLALLTSVYGLAAIQAPPGLDFDRDGVIGLGDLNILAQHMGSRTIPP